MRLHKHAELVEAMARELCRRRNMNPDEIMDGNYGNPPWWTHWEGDAAAALDALLEAAVRLEVAEIADVDGVARPYSIIALRMEASDDK